MDESLEFRSQHAQHFSKFATLCSTTLSASRLLRMMAPRRRSRLDTPLDTADSTSMTAVSNDITSQNLSELRFTGCTSLHLGLSDSHAVETLEHGLNTYQLELRQCEKQPLLAKKKYASYREMPGKHSVEWRYNTPVHKAFLEPLTKDVCHKNHTFACAGRMLLLFRLLMS